VFHLWLYFFDDTVEGAFFELCGDLGVCGDGVGVGDDVAGGVAGDAEAAGEDGEGVDHAKAFAGGVEAGVGGGEVELERTAGAEVSGVELLAGADGEAAEKGLHAGVEDIEVLAVLLQECLRMAEDAMAFGVFKL